MIVRVIAAVDEAGGIGRDGRIPWNSPDDRAQFRRLTWKSTILMGRATYESIGRPLPGRTNVVLTSCKDMKIEGCEVFDSLTEVLSRFDDLWVIGGESVYSQTVRLAEEVHLTSVLGDYRCDRFFPSLIGFTGRIIRYNFRVVE